MTSTEIKNKLPTRKELLSAKTGKFLITRISGSSFLGMSDFSDTSVCLNYSFTYKEREKYWHLTKENLEDLISQLLFLREYMEQPKSEPALSELFEVEVSS